jgi:hypothetical protein
MVVKEDVQKVTRAERVSIADQMRGTCFRSLDGK